jgi:hypothetical protein
MWVWEHTHDEDRAAADSVLHRPACVEAVGKTNLDANRLAEEVTAFQDADSPVAILYTPTSNVYTARHKQVVNGAYRAASTAGVEVDIVTESIVQEDGLADYDVVVVPQATNVEADTVAGVADYAGGDGALIVAGENALSRTPYDTKHGGGDRSTVMDGATVLSGDVGREGLRNAIEDAIEAGGFREVTVRDTEADELARGVEWRTVEHDGRRLVSVANYRSASASLAVHVDGEPAGSATDLLTGDSVDASGFSLGAEVPALLEL